MKRITVPTALAVPTVIGLSLALAIGCRSAFSAATDGLSLELEVTSANPHVLATPVELTATVKNVLEKPITVAGPRFDDMRSWHGHSPLVISVRPAAGGEWRVINAANPDFPITSLLSRPRQPPVVRPVSLEAGERVPVRVSLTCDWRSGQKSPIFEHPGKYWVRVSYQPFKIRHDVPDDDRAKATLVSEAIQVEIRAPRDGEELQGWVAEEAALQTRLKDKMRPYVIAGQWQEAVAVVEGDRFYQENKARLREINELLVELRKKGR
jgi:hypothetical protein